MVHVALPLIGDEPRERADAARNRGKVLAAAERLFAERGVECTSMDAIAVAAGVGKGTLFRRFGDRAGLAQALVDERERAFQEAFIRGPSPLGPGAPPHERLVAFCSALVDLLESHGDLVLAAETGRPGVRFRQPVYAAYRTHVTVLVREADPRLDAELTADALLAALGADLFLYARRVRGIDAARFRAGIETLVRRVLPGS